MMSVITKLVRVLWIRQYRAAFLRTRVAASTEHDGVLAGLQLDTVIDIGANRGQFALCMRRLYPRAQIFSFEPLQKPAATYKRLFAGDPLARLFNTAIAPQSGSAAMHVSQWDVSSSLLPIGQAQQDNFPFTREARRETVQTATLAECIGAAAITGRTLLKLDVQGFELEALQGCDGLLASCAFVYVEVSFVELYVGQALATDIVAFLLARGFALRCVANVSTGRSGKPIQADFLFARVGITI